MRAEVADATLALGDPCLCGLDAKVLVVARPFPDTGIEDNEVVDQLQEALLVAHLQQCLIEPNHLRPINRWRPVPEAVAGRARSVKVHGRRCGQRRHLALSEPSGPQSFANWQGSQGRRG